MTEKIGNTSDLYRDLDAEITSLPRFLSLVEVSIGRPIVQAVQPEEPPQPATAGTDEDTES